MLFPICISDYPEISGFLLFVCFLKNLLVLQKSRLPVSAKIMGVRCVLWVCWALNQLRPMVADRMGCTGLPLGCRELAGQENALCTPGWGGLCGLRLGSMGKFLMQFA